MPVSDGIIFRRVNRPDRGLVDRARGCSVADLHEASGPVRGREQLMSPRMRPLLAGCRIAGPAVTARCAPGDNLMMHHALYLAQPGDVLVVKAYGVDCGAQWGDTAARYAKRKGLAGIVVDGGIRDVDDLREIESPVWSTAISPAHPDKTGAGVVNAPIVCDGVRVCPGDLVVADGDGVLVLPRDVSSEIIERALARAALEEALAARTAAGEHLFEIMTLERNIQALGIPVHDRAWED